MTSRGAQAANAIKTALDNTDNPDPQQIINDLHAQGHTDTDLRIGGGALEIAVDTAHAIGRLRR